MDSCTCSTPFLRKYSWAKTQECPDRIVDVATDTCVRDLGMCQPNLAWIAEHRSIDFILGTDHNINQAQGRAKHDTEGAGITPLIRAKVDIERYRCTSLMRRLGGVESRAAAWLPVPAG